MGPGGTSLLWPHNPPSQVPDLNGSVAALQAAAWPLRQLGTVTGHTIYTVTVYIGVGFCIWITSGHSETFARNVTARTPYIQENPSATANPN